MKYEFIRSGGIHLLAKFASVAIIENMAWRESSSSGVKGHGFSTHRVKAKFEDLQVSLLNTKWIFIVRRACICIVNFLLTEKSFGLALKV